MAVGISKKMIFAFAQSRIEFNGKLTGLLRIQIKKNIRVR